MGDPFARNALADNAARDDCVKNPARTISAPHFYRYNAYALNASGMIEPILDGK